MCYAVEAQCHNLSFRPSCCPESKTHGVQKHYTLDHVHKYLTLCRKIKQTKLSRGDKRVPSSCVKLDQIIERLFPNIFFTLENLKRLGNNKAFKNKKSQPRRTFSKDDITMPSPTKTIIRPAKKKRAAKQLTIDVASILRSKYTLY